MGQVPQYWSGSFPVLSTPFPISIQAKELEKTALEHGVKKPEAIIHNSNTNWHLLTTYYVLGTLQASLRLIPMTTL